MKRQWIIAFFIVLNSCRPASTVFPPGWQRTLTVSNSAHAFKITLGWKRSDTDSTRALFYVVRTNPSTDFLDYREGGVLRAGMLDTFELTPDQSTDLYEWTRTEMWKSGDGSMASEGSGDQFVMRFDGDENVSFVGLPSEKNNRKFIEWALQHFEDTFQKLDFVQSSIILTVSDRVHNRIDSVRFVHRENNVQVFGNRSANVDWTEYLELWRILENYKVWLLPSDSSYAVSYPVEYHLKISRDGRSYELKVFAPSKLSVKRYYYIVNAIETAGVFQPAW
ncbi:hypothetical protein K1X84_10680 [bacterium]|nr:hypothetical protein [bacterium]